MFSQASVILSTGVMSIPACTGADTPHPGQTPLAGTPSLDTPPSADSPFTDTPWQPTPFTDTARQTPPSQTPPNGHCSGRYASYWNEFLFADVVLISVLNTSSYLGWLFQVLLLKLSSLTKEILKLGTVQFNNYNRCCFQKDKDIS